MRKLIAILLISYTEDADIIFESYYYVLLPTYRQWRFKCKIELRIDLYSVVTDEWTSTTARAHDLSQNSGEMKSFIKHDIQRISGVLIAFETHGDRAGR